MRLVVLLAAALASGDPTAAGAVTPPPELSAVARSSRVVLLGERHGEPASHALFLALVRDAVAAGERVWVGLEIPGDRQEELDRAVAGERRGTALAHPLVDAPSYGALVRALGRLGGALTVRAIDAPTTGDTPRDRHMAREVAAADADGAVDRVLVLVGNLHALRSIPWAAEAAPSGPKLAGLLAAEGVALASILQAFPPSCGRGLRPTFAAPGRPAAVAAVRALWDVLHTEPAGDDRAATAADGAVAWACVPERRGAPLTGAPSHTGLRRTVRGGTEP